MPTYHWNGRTKNGESISGTLDAASRDEVVAAPQGRGIVVTSVAGADRAAAPPEGASWQAIQVAAGDGRWRAFATRALMGSLLLVGGFFLASIATGIWIDCAREPSDESYQCRVEKRMAGVWLFSNENLQRARSAASEERTTGSYDRRTRYSSLTRTRVVITGPFGSVASEWMAYPIPSSPIVVNRLNRFFEGQGQPTFKSRQIESAPVGAAIMAAIVGLVFLASALSRLLSR